MIYGKYYRQVLGCEGEGSQDQESNNFLLKSLRTTAQCTVYTVCLCVCVGVWVCAWVCVCVWVGKAEVLQCSHTWMSLGN